MKLKNIYPLGLVALALSCFAQPISTPTMIGVNLSGGDFGTSNMPGTLGTDYFYPSAPHWDWAKGQGLELVRVPFRWERVQHETNGVLDAALWAPDIAALDASIDLAEARGLRVILDMHNYGERKIVVDGVASKPKIGSAALPASEFARAWRLLADHFKDRESIWGYDLMNEANGIAGGATTWPSHVQAAVTAIREVDTRHAIVLEGYFYAQASSWLTNGAPLINVVDPANNLVYSAHMYPDRGADGLWNNGGTVQAEIVNDGSYPDVATALDVGKNRVKPFVDWCVANNVRGLVGEYGAPRVIDTANWTEVLNRTLDYMTNHGNGLVSGTQWGGGAWNATYVVGMGQRVNNSAPPFMPVVKNYVSGPGDNFWYGYTLYEEAPITTADYTFSYVYPNTTPATITFNTGDTSTAYAGTKSIALTYTVPTGSFAGAGIHVRGPLAAGGVGGIDLSQAAAAGQVLSFYAKGTPGASPRITFGSTLNASGVDGGSDTGTGNWISLGSIHPLTADWQLYEIPLTAFLNASVTGATPVQRLRFDALPANGNTYEVHIDKVRLLIPSTNTAPSVTVNTSTGASVFTTGQSVGLVAAASDANAGDSVEYVEFYANDQKVGIDDSAPYQWTTSFNAVGTYEIRAITVDSHGISSRSAAKTLTITANPPTTVSLTSTVGEDGWVLESTATSSVGGSFSAGGKVRIGDDAGNRQYVAILSFDTSSIPDGAVITAATLKLTRDGSYNTDPYTTHGAANVSICSGGLNGSTALEAADFQATATASDVATLSAPATNGALSTGTLNASGLTAINKAGKTQVRVAFTSGDNGDAGADYMQFNSSGDITPAKRPTLTITYQ